MPRVLRWLAVAAGLAIGAPCAALVVAHFHDGPIGPFTGGPFRSGVESPVPSDWSFAAGGRTLELELPPDAGRAVTTWYAVVDGKLYVPCGLAKQKRWPHAVLADGRVRVRIDGKIYALAATRVDDPATLSRVAPEIGAKYGVPHDGFGTRDWIFALAPR
jgi:hypothetical protein